MRKKNSIWQKEKTYNQLEIQSMVWPALIFLFVFSYIPMYGIIIAFKDFNIFSGFFNGKFVGLKYFRQFFTDPSLFGVVKNTLVINIMGLIFGFPAPIILALMITSLKGSFFKKIAQTASYLPYFLSWVIFGGIIIELLSSRGFVNSIIRGIGLSKSNVNYMGNPKYFYGIFTVISIIKTIGYGSILYIAAITGVNPELYEAANIDGAGRWRKIWNITLPSISGTIVIMLIFQISNILNTGFEQILILQNKLNIGVSETIDTYVYKVGMQQQRYSYATAVGLIKSAIAVVLLISANKICKKLTDKGLF